MSHLRAILVLLVCSRPSLAQVPYEPEHREWEATPFVGQSFSNTSHFRTPVIGSSQESSRTIGMGYSSGLQVGVRVNQNLGDYWGADLEYSFATQYLRFTNLSPTIQNLSLNQYIHHLSYDVLFLPLPRTKRFRPYVDAGLGVGLFHIPERVKGDALGLGLKLRDSWELVFDLGGGFTYLIADQYAVTFDVKDRLSRVPSYGLPPFARVVNGQFIPGISPHGVLQNVQLNIGFTVQWDEW
jgi:opacity protein-like surface antigen